MSKDKRGAVAKRWEATGSWQASFHPCRMPQGPPPPPEILLNHLLAGAKIHDRGTLWRACFLRSQFTSERCYQRTPDLP